MFLKKLLVVGVVFVLAVALYIAPAEATKKVRKPVQAGRLIMDVGSQPEPRVGKVEVSIIPKRGVGMVFEGSGYPILVNMVLIQGKQYQIWVTVYDQSGKPIGFAETTFTMKRIQRVQLDPVLIFPEPPPFELIGSDPMITGKKISFAHDGEFAVANYVYGGGTITLYTKYRWPMRSIEALHPWNVLVDSNKVVWYISHHYQTVGINRFQWGWGNPENLAIGNLWTVDLIEDGQDIIACQLNGLMRVDRVSGSREEWFDFGGTSGRNQPWTIAIAGQNSVAAHGLFLGTWEGLAYLNPYSGQISLDDKRASIDGAYGEDLDLIYHAGTDRVYLAAKDTVYIFDAQGRFLFSRYVGPVTGIAYNPADGMLYTIGSNGLSWYRP